MTADTQSHLRDLFGDLQNTPERQIYWYNTNKKWIASSKQCVEKLLMHCFGNLFWINQLMASSPCCRSTASFFFPSSWWNVWVKLSFYSLFVWVNSFLKVEPARNILRRLSWAQKNTIKVRQFFFYFTLFSLKGIFRGKVPLEPTRFSHTLLNLPQTFVKELKGINWRKSSVERFTWDTL